MRRWLLLIVILGAVVWAWNRWSSAPPPALPDVVWTPGPFRGPTVASDPGSSRLLDARLHAISADPLVEDLPSIAPEPRVAVIPSPRWDRRVSTYIGWREPIPDGRDLTPATAALWGARWYRHTGTMRTVGSTRWAEYRREDAK